MIVQPPRPSLDISLVGATFPSYDAALYAAHGDAEAVVEVSGTRQQVAALAANVRLGHAERRRRARRRQQANSRRRNR